MVGGDGANNKGFCGEGHPMGHSKGHSKGKNKGTLRHAKGHHKGSGETPNLSET